jgi:hypothetical protein
MLFPKSKQISLPTKLVDNKLEYDELTRIR